MRMVGEGRGVRGELITVSPGPCVRGQVGAQVWRTRRSGNVRGARLGLWTALTQ